MREPKARHGRREMRRRWALTAPAGNGYAGRGGDHGVAWPYLRQVSRRERERVHLLIENQVEVEPLGELTLKGFRRPVGVFNVVALRPVAPGARPASA